MHFGHEKRWKSSRIDAIIILFFQSIGFGIRDTGNNLLACRFYAKCGFIIGAVNTMLYRNFDNEDEFAVF